ncbi:MAG: DegT/DnrJ/EryC1/StrS family aminotransferase [Ferroplasma sp.]|uniref:DegT/DnrJ/EryC1/StrS family aminotransferase n=1 Tax=Ferroplasma sp. TaxID=2591003 RepID=UPI0028158C42|nr:DegT/DnrJ/EryC1/StrS family aminotransferase [Ferroplasma sp.]WMT50653.1 MAG: DegT/DnrJ/EryC1/StrS family aminotransferase [Ferroplasma sp.]
MIIKFQNFNRLYNDLKLELDTSYFETMSSGYYILGSKLKEFENNFSKFVESKYCIGVASGLDALTIALKSLNLEKGSEVIVPANTYIATFIAIIRAGYVPIPVDADIRTLQIDANLIPHKITEKTRVIMPVHLYYQTPDMDVINEIAKENNLRVITDAAQGHGAKYKGKVVGSLAEAECFSFYPTKNLGAIGDAGCIATDNDNINYNSKLLRNYGEKENYVSYLIGYNSRLDEIQAGFLNAKLKYLNKWNERRRYIADRYLNEIHNKRIVLPEIADYATPNWYIFPIFSEQRERIKSELQKKGIMSIIHYPVPPYLQPALKYLKYDINSLVNSSKIADTELSIPIDPYLNEDEISYVIDSINNI